MSRETQATLHALRRGDLAGATELRLTGLTEFPREIFGLADSLDVLDLSDCALSTLPDDFGRLHRLRALFCMGNRFERLPAAMSDCAALSQIGFRRAGVREVPGEALPPKLRWLILTDNQIARLPDALGERPALQKVMLAGNRLSELPASLAQAHNLELLRLSANCFERLPDWLAELPSLAWLSWSGAAFERPLPPTATRDIGWSDLEMSDHLGEGASGRVYRALWRGAEGGEALPVAMKLFKGAMTSDGLPDREMAACLAAGRHPNLISALGRLTDHPDGDAALVMPLLPARWRALAGPPSAHSCSRDVYAEGFALPPATALRIARNIAAATAHLHARGIMHGDLYAHNILWDGESGDAVLSDFGAACILPEGARSDRWRRLETRAWGVLLDELLDCCTEAPANMTAMRALAQACTHAQTEKRPLMTEALDTIDRLAA